MFTDYKIMIQYTDKFNRTTSSNCQSRDCVKGNGGRGAHYHELHGGSTATMQIAIMDSFAPGQHDMLGFKEEFWTMATMGFCGLNQREEMERKTRRVSGM